MVRESSIPALNIPANPRKAGTEKQVEPISGPSVLGIGGPSLDSLREKTFSGGDSFFEPEEPKTGGRKVLLLILLAALGVATWWTYTNYIAIGDSQKRQAAASNSTTSMVPAQSPAAPQPAPETKSTDAAQTPPSTSAQTSPPPSTEAPSPAAVEKQPAQANDNSESKPEVAATVAAPKPKTHEKRVTAARSARTDRHTTGPKPALTVTASDTGDDAFRKGEAYLYGRGVPKNCDQAVKYLKDASAKAHPRARSTFGTMYATGHCVPRDLPTAYVWFAQALRVDPNNQILEKDLSALWNQMTPPERQLATKMRQ
jgi:hypothetical protein